jgi:uncharacterized membrane protein
MRQLRKHRVQSRIGTALGTAAAALLCVIALSLPNLAYAGPHGGGGGFHGGGFHGGGFHGGGFHGGGFHGGGFHGGGFHGRGFGGFHGRGFHAGGFHPGFGVFYYPYYGYYDYGQPPSSQTWYYCSDPAGYYPYVTQCDAGWQTVPAS